MIGNYPDFQVREYAWKWYGKWLTDENLAEIDTLIEAQYIIPEAPVVEDNTTTEDEISADDITGGVIEETEIIEDSTNEEVIDESTDETPEAESTEPTE
mgnify:CR=1 FL=1